MAAVAIVALVRVGDGDGDGEGEEEAELVSDGTVLRKLEVVDELRSWRLRVLGME